MLNSYVISFRVHHGRKFIEMPRKRYVNGQLRFYYKFEKDYVSLFEIKEIVEHFGYLKGDELFYLLPHKLLQISIRPI